MMRKFLAVVAGLLFTATIATAQVPDYSTVVVDQFHRTQHDTKTQEGAGKFTEEVASRLYQLDPNFGHLRKSPPRTRCGEPPHACDVVLYLATGQIVDILRDGGGPDAAPSWSVGPFGEYTQADWMGPAITNPTIPPGTGMPGTMPVLPSAEILKRLKEIATAQEELSAQSERIFKNLTDQVTGVRTSLEEHREEARKARSKVLAFISNWKTVAAGLGFVAGKWLIPSGGTE